MYQTKIKIAKLGIILLHELHTFHISRKLCDNEFNHFWINYLGDNIIGPIPDFSIVLSLTRL